MIFCRPMLRNLATAVAAVTLGLAPVGAQVVSPVPVTPACLAIADPFPSGPNAAPLDTFASTALFGPGAATSNDYHWMHSSVHLQGAPELEKWGACVFFNPDASQTTPVDMSDWRSAVVVNNPSPTVTVNIKVTYRAPSGAVLASIPATLAPEATFVRGAVELRQFGQGIGSVQVTADHPIVGATIHHFGRMTMSNGDLVTDPDYLSPGGNSMQQLQKIQDSATTLYGGPYPATNVTTEDFMNGVLPLHCVVNPNPTATTVTTASFIAPGSPLTSQTVTLQPFGMLLDTSIWAVAEPIYLSNPAPFDLDLLAAAFSSGNPIIGDFLMVDVFGNGGPANLELGGRFRMGSGMMQIQPALRLFNPEHIETSVPGPLPATPPVTTLMSVANVSGVNVGPVSVDFYPRTGGAPVTVTFASLAPGAVQRITRSTAGVPQNFAGWARIRACQPGLIGWTMREVEQQPGLFQQFRKVYGEELDGANLKEPGSGFTVVSGGQSWVRKVAPLHRAAGNFSNPNWWPSYQIGVNHASANIGPYWHRFFTLPGILAGQATFAGLQFANTSFTYVDPIVNLINNDANISGRFDRQGGQAIGMEAIGDPLREWNIPAFLGSDVQVILGPMVGGFGEH